MSCYCKNDKQIFIDYKKTTGNQERKIAAYIIYHLKKKNITQKDIAIKLGVTPQMVQQVIYGKKKSKRVQEEIAIAIGHSSWKEVLKKGEQ